MVVPGIVPHLLTSEAQRQLGLGSHVPARVQ